MTEARLLAIAGALALAATILAVREARIDRRYWTEADERYRAMREAEE